MLHFLVRQLEERVQQAELVDHLERGRVDGVAAEVAQEVGVLLEHHDRDAGARQQETEHHAGGSAAGDAAGGGELGRQLSSPVGMFLFSLSSFTPDASAIVSISAAKSFCRYSSE